MASQKVLDQFSASAALTITIASLASSSTLTAARQSTTVDNTTNKYTRIKIYFAIKLGTSPTANKTINFYLIRADNNGTIHRDGGAGASDAAFTIPPNLLPIHSIPTGSAPSTGDVLKGSFDVYLPGPEWGIALVHDSGANLDSTAGNHYIRWIGSNADIQAAA